MLGEWVGEWVGECCAKDERCATDLQLGLLV